MNVLKGFDKNILSDVVSVLTIGCHVVNYRKNTFAVTINKGVERVGMTSFDMLYKLRIGRILRLQTLALEDTSAVVCSVHGYKAGCGSLI